MPVEVKWRRGLLKPSERERLKRNYSAGSRPSSAIDPLVIEVMKEKGIDLSARHPKGIMDLPPVGMDFLVTMGCEETCPAVIAKKVIAWEIPDPKGKSLDEIRRIRDMIEARVKALLEDGDSHR
jgi:arsenate reductase